MDPFQKLIERVIGVADDQNWAPLRQQEAFVDVVIKQLGTSIPLRLVMQQNIGNLQQNQIVGSLFQAFR